MYHNKDLPCESSEGMGSDRGVGLPGECVAVVRISLLEHEPTVGEGDTGHAGEHAAVDHNAQAHPAGVRDGVGQRQDAGAGQLADDEDTAGEDGQAAAAIGAKMLGKTFGGFDAIHGWLGVWVWCA